MSNEIERTSTHEFLEGMAQLALKTPAEPVVASCYRLAELLHEYEIALPDDAALRLLQIGASLWAKSRELNEAI